MKKLLSLFSLAMLATVTTIAQSRPNVGLIYADGIGYGDVSCYSATAGHAPAATCTPSRYAMLTGEYAWRREGTGILPGNAALIIEPGRATMATVFQQAGYATAVVGKWHLGLEPKGGPDWNGEIKPSPNEIGFDYSYIMAATGDRVLTVYVENRFVA